MNTVQQFATQVRAESLSGVVSGFTFAAAIAWMDVVKFIIGQLINVKVNGAPYYLLTALFTTLLSVIVFMTIQRFSNNQVKVRDTTYSVTSSR